LKRILLSICSLAAVLLSSLALSACGGASGETLPTNANADTTAILVHGAWADGSSWSGVIPLLKAAGLKVVAVQLPRTSVADDAATVKRAIAAQSGSVILAGHSYGGAVITEAGTDPKVAALVYVSAFAPGDGQSINDILQPFPKPAWQSTIQVDSGGYLTLPQETVATYLAPDVPKPAIDIITATQGPLFAHCFDDKITVAAWKTKPAWWVLSLQDQIIPAPLQQGMATAINATVATVGSGHLTPVTHPNEVAAAIISAARQTGHL
jgi:pimeloyl-ACP methyl ester carboxylesterase